MRFWILEGEPIEPISWFWLWGCDERKKTKEEEDGGFGGRARERVTVTAAFDDRRKSRCISVVVLCSVVPNASYTYTYSI